MQNSNINFAGNHPRCRKCPQHVCLEIIDKSLPYNFSGCLRINIPLQKTWLNAKFLPILARFLKPRTDEKFLLDKFLVKIIFSCARQTIFVINFSVTSFITTLHVADTSKYFMYIYYIGLKTSESLILCTASSNQSISLSNFPGWPYTGTVFPVQKLA